MTFNPRDELRKLASADAHLGGRKLTFKEQCAAFAASYDGVRNKVIARAFGISPQTASLIAGCLEHDPDPYRRDLVVGADGAPVTRIVERDHNKSRHPNRNRRYENVALEFETLGVDEFNARYMTPEIIARLTAARRLADPTRNASK